MSRYRLSRHWDIQGHDEVAEELGKALAAFGVQKAAAEGEFTASLRHLKTFGRHPEELPGVVRTDVSRLWSGRTPSCTRYSGTPRGSSWCCT